MYLHKTLNAIAFFAKLLRIISKGATPAELMALRQDWVTSKQAFSSSLFYENHI